MILGASPLAIMRKPPPYRPWKDPRFLTWWDCAAPKTVVSGKTVAAPSLVNPAHIMAPPAFLQDGTTPAAGPTEDTSIGGQPTWVANGTNVILQCASFPLPAINATTPLWIYAVWRADASASGFNLLCSGGLTSAVNPSTRLKFLGGGIQSYLFTTVDVNKPAGSPPGNYVEGTAKRSLQFFAGATATGLSLMRWGSVTASGTTSDLAAESGFTLFGSGDKNPTQLVQGALVALGIATGDPAVGSTFAMTEAYMASRFGSTPWGALTS